MADEMRTGTHRNVIAESIRRHIIFVLVVAVAITCAAVAFTATRPHRYTSTTKVLITPVIGNPLSPEDLSSGQQTTVAMTTESAVVTAPEVIDAAVEAMLPVEIPPASAVTAFVPPNTKIVEIQVTDSSADRAANGAEAYAKAYLAYREAQALEVIDNEKAVLNGQLAVATTELKAASRVFNSQNPPADAGIQVQRWASQVASLTNSIGNLEATDTAPGKIVSKPVPPDSPNGLNSIVLVLAALFLGLGAGALLAIWRERRDDRIRTAYDDEVADLPVLATLPGRRRTSPSRLARLGAEDELRSCYRRARAAVIAGTPGPAVLVVSSVDRGSAVVDPAGEVAANIGWSLTVAGFSVTLVDASIGHGHVAELMGLQTGPGLSDQLMANSSSAPVTQHSFGMAVLTAGRNPEASREYYAGARLTKCVSWFTKDSDYVIVAGPPIGTSDGEAVALVGDALLCVVVDKETTHTRVASVAARMSRLGVRMIGAVGLQRRVDERPGPEQTKPGSPEAVAPRSGRRGSAAPRAEDPPHVPASAPADSSRGHDGR